MHNEAKNVPDQNAVETGVEGRPTGLCSLTALEAARGHECAASGGIKRDTGEWT